MSQEPSIFEPCLVFAIVTVLVYSNADLQKEQILDDNKKKFGIYRWTNKKNGKSYVGSSNNLSKRFSQYFNLLTLRKYKGSSSIIRALLKYGYSNFTLEILEYCDPSKVISREQYYLDSLNPEYNILKVAGSSFGYKHTEETISKMRNSHLNRIWREEDKTKAREILSTGSLARSQAILVTNKLTGDAVEYPSKRQAAKELKVSDVTINNYLRSGKLLKDIWLISNK